MAIRFEEYGARHVEAVCAFNRRIEAAVDPDLLFPEKPFDWWLPKGGHAEIFQEAFVALEGDTVRGGYFLKHQPFWVNGETRRVSSYRLPVSEGVVNRAYTAIALQTIRDALARQPLLFSLGMGSLDAPVAKLEKAAGWSQYVVPFRFRVVHGGRFLRNISALRSTPLRRALADAAAWSGAGSLGFAALGAARSARIPSGISVEPFREFESWADELWARAKEKYSIAAVRDRDISNTLYPVSDARFLKWRITDKHRILGWAVALDTKMRGHKQFGDLRVATIVDGMADPADAPVLLAAVAREVERGGADLVISNQMHAAWVEGLRSCGFLGGPSNYIFSASKNLAASMAPFDQAVLKGHMNRGDGDGPIHL